MENVKNSILLEAVLKALYTVTGRRTSSRFADKTIGSTIKTLEETYNFLKYVRVNDQSVSGNDFNVDVSSDIDFVEPGKVGKAIEAIIRVVYTDLDEDAGLYFIAELKKYAGDEQNQIRMQREEKLAMVHRCLQEAEKPKRVIIFSPVGPEIYEF